jgi:hypothetical protein
MNYIYGERLVLSGVEGLVLSSTLRSQTEGKARPEGSRTTCGEHSPTIYAQACEFRRKKILKINTRNTRKARNTYRHSFYLFVFTHLEKNEQES